MRLLKNLYHILKRFRSASLLNLFGLSLAFAAFLVIMMQVRYEQQYDWCHQHRNRVYRLEWNANDVGWVAVISRPLAYATLEASSHVEAMALTDPSFNTHRLTVRQDGEPKSFKECFTEVSPDVTKIFSFEWVEGDSLALTQPATVIIPQTLAQKMFPHGSAIGQQLETTISTWVIGAVYKDFPKNSTIKNNVYFPLDRRNEDMNWGNANNYAYVMFDTPDATEGFLEALVDHVNTSYYGYAEKEEMRANVHAVFRLNPLSNVYYSNEVNYVFTETGSRETTFLLICIAFIVILIAGINFTNFTIALTPLRIKSINTQKILGSTQGRLRRAIMGEGVLISFFSFLMALLIVYACKGTFLTGLIQPGITFAGHWNLVVFTALVSLLTGLLAGVYPAFYMTSFPSAMVLKGSFGLSMKGKRLRTSLLCIQYVASISLLIVATFMMLQNKHLLNSSFGYDNHRLLTVEVSDQIVEKADAFSNELKQSQAIEEVAYAYTYLSCMDDASTWGRHYKGEDIMFSVFLVSPDILKTLGIEVTEGHDFLQSEYETQESYIFNQLAKDQYNLEVGNEPDLNIVGFIPNIVFNSLRTPVTPMAFMLMQKDNYWFGIKLNVCYVRVKEGPYYQAAEEQIEKTMKQFDPTYPFEIHPLDYHIEEAYRSEKNTSWLITLFGVLSILISMVGIYGLVVFETEYKRREIGVRKVFGSTTREVMQRFSQRYMWLILGCTIVAAPLSYFIVDKWLSRFTTRIPISWWVFVAAFLAVAIVTMATTTWQNYRAASANPVDSLKNE